MMWSWAQSLQGQHQVGFFWCGGRGGVEVMLGQLVRMRVMVSMGVGKGGRVEVVVVCWGRGDEVWLGCGWGEG
jgi:hypothetical protein